MIRLEKITWENENEVFSLEVTEEQSKFIVSNMHSIATAYVLLSIGGYPIPIPFAIYNDETIIGFVLIVYGTYGSLEIAKNNYGIMRFMIDKRQQNKGFGREAMNKIIEYIRTFPQESAEYCWLTYSSNNVFAKKLYKNLGFVETGETFNGEILALLKL